MVWRIQNSGFRPAYSSMLQPVLGLLPLPLVSSQRLVLIDRQLWMANRVPRLPCPPRRRRCLSRQGSIEPQLELSLLPSCWQPVFSSSYALSHLSLLQAHQLLSPAEACIQQPSASARHGAAVKLGTLRALWHVADSAVRAGGGWQLHQDLLGP